MLDSTLLNPSQLQRYGILCVVSGPSGSGKTTLCHRFSESDDQASYAISATTRSPREGEVDGEDYYFLSRDDFEQRIESGEFLEYAEVHGNLYGTLRSEVLDRLARGKDVLIDIDVQGAASIRSHRNEVIDQALIDIFIMPPDGEELVERLTNRGTENQAQLEVRLRNAREEMRHWRDYQFTIFSGTRDDDFAAFSAIIHGERCRTLRFQG